MKQTRIVWLLGVIIAIALTGCGGAAVASSAEPPVSALEQASAEAEPEITPEPATEEGAVSSVAESTEEIEGEASVTDERTAEPLPEPSEPAPWTDHLLSARTVTKVFGDGQKIASVALEYDAAIDSATVDPADYTVADQEVTGAYVSDHAGLVSESTSGSLVIVTVNTGYENELVGGIGNPNSVSNQLAASVSQIGDIADEAGSQFLGNDTVLDTDYTETINLVVDDFQQLVFSNPEDGSELMYNLFVPENTDEALPLVLFMPDATGSGTDPVKTLTQGLGAVVWAEPDSQAENPCYVLAPQYTNQPTDAANTLSLLDYVVEHYNVDANRLYTTGQSAGTIKSIQFMIDNPDLFAAALLVAGQAENGYEERIGELAGQNLWMVCSTGDARANPGMTAIMEAVEAEGTEVTTGQWSCLIPQEEQNAEAAKMEEAGTSINFTVLSEVVPDGMSDSAVAEHLCTWRVAYSIPEIRNWVFRQRRNG